MIIEAKLCSRGLGDFMFEYELHFAFHSAWVILCFDFFN